MVAVVVAWAEQVVQDYLAPSVAYWNTDVWPVAVDVYHQLDIPAWELYRPALEECASDLYSAGQSTAHLWYLTLKPLVILSWIILQVLGRLGQFLFRILLEQGFVQLQKGLLQAKAASIWFYNFQCSLNRNEIIGEIAAIVLLIGLYYLQKWLRRQTYWSRFVRWYSKKKRAAMETSNKVFNRVARVSLILAMTLPHLAFLGGYVAVKTLFPSLVKWLAYDTYACALISIWYPLVMTISWVHNQRHPMPQKAVTSAAILDDAPKETTKQTTARHSHSPSYMKATAAQKAREGASAARQRRSTPSVFPRTAPPISPASTTDSEQTVSGSPSKTSASRASTSVHSSPDVSKKYWLRYWIVFALVQCVGTFGTLVPVFGRFVAQHPFVLHICSELKLLFFIWLFAMEQLIGTAVSVQEEDTMLAQAMPLRLIHSHVAPVLLELETIVSQAVTEETWMAVVHSKVKRVLELIVMIQLLSEDRKDWLLHVVEEGRPLVIPSLCLLMPSFITQYGVVYVQYIIPSAKSARAIKRSKFANAKEFLDRSAANKAGDGPEWIFLQYWILHCLLAGALSYFATLLWWIPFSTHITFVLWCHLSLPKTVSQYYQIVESELIAFGLLHGDSDVQFHETKTAQVFQAVCQRLPSASNISEEDEEEVGKDDDRLVKPSIEADSQEIEVLIEPRQQKDKPGDEADNDDGKDPQQTLGDENVMPSKSGILRQGSATGKWKDGRSDDDDDEYKPEEEDTATQEDESAQKEPLRRSTRQRKAPKNVQ